MAPTHANVRMLQFSLKHAPPTGLISLVMGHALDRVQRVWRRGTLINPRVPPQMSAATISGSRHLCRATPAGSPLGIN
jgi:hypothetical protein